MKLLFPYNGSNANLLSEINRFVVYAPHVSTCNEAFAGTAVFSLNKPAHALNNINDKNGELINFLRVLRTAYKRLETAVVLTAYSQEELELAYEPALEPVERARRFYVRQWLSRNAADAIPHLKVQKDGWGSDGKMIKVQARQFHDTSNFMRYAHKLAGCQIFNLDFTQFVARHDHERALTYFDPPFMPEVRENPLGLYTYEMTQAQHLELIEILLNLKGHGIVRHYGCALYDTLLGNGWQRVDMPHIRTNGRMESLYVSNTLYQLSMDNQKANVAQAELF